MTRSGHRTVLVALGVVAVALGSALFPPTGFGSAPASETDLVGPDAPASGDGHAPGPDGATADPGDSADDSSADRGTVDGTATDGSDGASSGATVTTVAASTRTATPTPTASPTPTATAIETTAERDDESGVDLLGIVGGLTLLFVLVLALVFVGRFVQALRESGGSAGGSAQSLGLFGGIARLFTGSPTAVAARIPQATMVALVGVSTGTARILAGAGSLASEAAGGFAFVFGAGARSLGKGFGSGLDGLFSLPSAPSLSLSGLFSGLGRGGTSTATGESPTADARATASIDPDSEEESADPIRTVEGAWEAFAAPLPVEDPEARTPGEFARLAVEHGDPRGPVRRLTRAFRDVRYGGRPPSGDLTRSAIDAVSDILADRDREDDR
ncbi:DUF4129 domain-containing protein [Halosimplex sp. TS25]|uniref:DUF4129 domain-containing protein n=1 Tax=Halosimplex rarum TaxID=3396619 RepID=UPI0039E745ED